MVIGHHWSCILGVLASVWGTGVECNAIKQSAMRTWCYGAVQNTAKAKPMPPSQIINTLTVHSVLQRLHFVGKNPLRSLKLKHNNIDLS